MSKAALLSNKKFIAIVGMLGSDGPGERANAAALAGKMMAEAGVTWADLLDGGGGGDTARLQTLLQSTQRMLDASQRREEIATTKLREIARELKTVRDSESKLLRQHADTVHQLRALNETIKKLQEARAEKKAEKPAWGFTDIPEDDRAGRTHQQPPQPEREYPIPHRKVKNWLDMVEANFWDDLSNWEKDFLFDFIENKKPIYTDRQYAKFQQAADRVGWKLDF